MDTIPEHYSAPESGQINSETIYKIFELELLREKILDYVIHDNGKVDISSAACCRLVSKLWLQSVSRILLLRQEPLLHLSFVKEDCNDASGTSCHKLDKFISDITGAFRVSECIPPLSITTFCYLRPQNLDSFSNCLLICGGSLTELSLLFLEDDAVISIYFPSKIILPNLRLFRVQFQNISFPTDPFTVGDKISLIQSVFDVSKNLKIFELQGGIFDNRDSRSFSNLIFPTSITTLNVISVFIDNNLELLVGNSFPNLKILNLCINSSPFNDQLISRILENFRKTLEHFHIQNKPFHCAHREDYTTFSLSPMEKLKSLEIDWSHVLQENISSLQQLVPLIKHLSLTEQKPSMLQRWTDRSRFESVNSLNISLAPNDADGPPPTFKWATMQYLKTCFPNIQKLDMMLRGTELCAIKFIMTEMKQLCQLRLWMVLEKEGACPWRGSGHVFDSIFIGFQREWIEALKKSQDLWDDMRLRCEFSMRDMTELHTLELVGENAENDIPLITDVSFQYSFFQMPKLKKLILKGSFFATKEMERRWEENGRSIVNTGAAADIFWG